MASSGKIINFLRKLNITVESKLFDKISTLNTTISKIYYNMKVKTAPTMVIIHKNIQQPPLLKDLFIPLSSMYFP